MLPLITFLLGFDTYALPQFCFKFDPNSLLYISKAMDLFSMEIESLQELSQARQAAARADALCPPDVKLPRAHNKGPQHISSLPSSHAYLPSLTAGLANLKNHPVMVLGVQSDILFPFEQQKEMAEAIRRNGNKRVVYYELDSPYGHDTCAFFISHWPDRAERLKLNRIQS